MRSNLINSPVIFTHNLVQHDNYVAIIVMNEKPRLLDLNLTIMFRLVGGEQNTS